MHWNFRPAKAEDLPACQRMLSDWARFTFDDEVRAALPHIWHELLTRKALTITIFEDLDLPLGRRLGGFNVGVFVADALTAEILAIPKPYLANRLYRSCLGKDPWPLGFPQIRQANSTTGVNLVLDYAFFTHDWRRLELFPLFAVVQDAFHFDFYGHHFRCILAEVFGEEARDYFLRWGFKTKGTPPGVGDGSCPFLMGLGKEEALSCAGSALASYFAAPAPKFYFRPSEQDLLRLALRNIGDQEAAEELGISVNTVKKCWQNIFQRVEDIDPAWFPGKTRDVARRGAKKRRHLLNYLAYHLEELRPRLRPCQRLDRAKPTKIPN